MVKTAESHNAELTGKIDPYTDTYVRIEGMLGIRHFQKDGGILILEEDIKPIERAAIKRFVERLNTNHISWWFHKENATIKWVDILAAAKEEGVEF